MSKDFETLHKDYKAITGKPFEHFYCPILHRDEKIELCKGHIINEDFPTNSPRTTITQRKDVDGFYGRVFESEVLKIRYKNYSLEEIITDRNANKQLKPFLITNGTRYRLYPTTPQELENIPDNHSTLSFDFDATKIFRVKIDPDSLERAFQLDEELSFSWQVDVSLYAIPALIKAAYLTMFHLIGYSYVLSGGGYYVGTQILGKFFLENHKYKDAQVRENAKSFFPRFLRMIRTVEPDFKGTLEDEIIVSCATKKVVWGFIVFVSLGTEMPLQAVMLPAGGFAGIGYFGAFLQGDIRHFETLVNKRIDLQWHYDADGWKQTIVEW
jgi:hypothetical protein